MQYYYVTFSPVGIVHNGMEVISLIFCTQKVYLFHLGLFQHFLLFDEEMWRNPKINAMFFL